MKNRMERLVVLPFTAGCISSSSVSVCIQHERRSKEDTNLAHMVPRSREVPKESKVISTPNIYIGFHRLTRTIKNLSQSLVFKDEAEELETEMEIGLPMDVKHVTHVGFDGQLNPDGNHCNNLAISDFLSLCSDSIVQHEQNAMFGPMDATYGAPNISCKSPKLERK